MPQNKPFLLRKLFGRARRPKQKSKVGDNGDRQDGNIAPRAVAEIAQKTTGDPVVGIAKDLVTDSSLWDRAYDTLKEEEPDRIATYEDLLSRVLLREQVKTPPTLNETTDAGKVTNQISQDDVIARREEMKKITELGLKHMEDKKVSKTLLGHEIILQDVLASAAGAVTWTEDYIKDAIKDLPYASIVLVGVSLVLPLLKNPAADEAINQDGFTYVTSQMSYYVAMEPLLLPQDMKPSLKADLTECLISLYKLIINFQVQSVIRFYRSRTKNFFRGTIKYDNWDKKLQDIKDDDKELVRKFEIAISSTNFDLVSRNLQELKNLAQEAEDSRKALNNLLIKVQEHTEVSRDQLAVLKKIDQHITDPQTQTCMQELQTTDPRDDKKRIEQTKGGLLKDSYHWILDNADFQEWRDNENSRLLWIKGDPGKGKTMLLCGIIDELEPTVNSSHDGLLSYFFCQATDLRINNATAVLRGLIYMLIVQQPSLISHLRKKYDYTGKNLFEGTNAWIALTEIFTNMMKDLGLKRTYLIVDALDECLISLPLLLDFISERSCTSPYVKWIVSSRNWPNIQERLETATQKVNLSLELNERSIADAVSIYTRYQVSKLASLKKYKNEVRNAVELYLLSNANGTFLWVALVCQHLEKIERWDTVAKLRLFPPGLDSLYQGMLEYICNLEDADLCKRILAVTLIVYRPITLKELTSFIDMPVGVSDDLESLGDIVGLCGSFLTIREDTIYFIHQSAKDYLTKSEINSILLPDRPARLHSNILSQSISAMSQTLRQDIYSLKNTGIPTQEARSASPDPLLLVRYACTYWVDHLYEIYNTSDDQQLLDNTDSIYDFLTKHFLHWLEALSLIRSLSHGVAMIRKLKDNLNLLNSNNQLSALIQDANRFILTFRDIIETAPLQVYFSSLVFSPSTSLIRNIFQNDWPSWITTPPRLAQVWSPCLQTLEGHTDWVNSVTFSPNGQQLASASCDKTVRLWDVATGTLQQTFEGHTDWVNSVTFSPNGQQLASASHDKTVRLWDVVTGTLKQTFEGYTRWVNSVTFSPNGQQLASASHDKIVPLWDLVTGTLQQTFEGHTDWVNSATFSPNGQQLASASHDKTVRLWDVVTGTLQQTFEGHTDWVNSVTFSPNGQQLASASSDNTVRIWDLVTGTLQQTFEGHTHLVNSVTFSPNGQQLASASHDKTVRLWDVVTGTLQQTFEGHTDWVDSVTFSPNGQQLASASRDKTVRLWDVVTGTLQQTFEGHTDWVNSVTFSPNGQQLASASCDKTVRLWDVVTDTPQQTFEGHTGWVNSVTFSPNGQQLASASCDKTVRLWDVVTDTPQQTFEGHTDWVNSAIFSPNGQQLASASSDKTVRLWDVVTGTLQQTFEGHTDWVNSVTFSPNGQQLASASRDKTVRLWDVVTDTPQQTFEGHAHCVNSVTFSPNSQQLASASSDKTVRLWDVVTGTLKQTFEGHAHWVNSVTFSPNGQQLASASHDKTVRLWDVVTGTLQQIFEGYTNSVIFSADGLNIITGCGTFNISHTVSQLDQTSKSAKYAIAQSQKWITWNGSNILWLPPEYRPSAFAIEKSCIAFGCASGMVYILNFRPDILPFV